MSMQQHLRGKPNREARIKVVLDKLRKRQKEEMDRVIAGHDAQTQKLAEQVATDKNALQAAYALVSADNARTSQTAVSSLQKTVAVERKWFEVAARRRKTVFDEQQQQLWRSSGIQPTTATSAERAGAPEMQSAFATPRSRSRLPVPYAPSLAALGTI